MKIIRSPIKVTTLNECYNRSFYATFENSLSVNDKTLMVVF
jgi:hypothetical protein